MALDHTKIHWGISEVIVSPTTLTGGSPYGGTVIGYTESGVELILDEEWIEVRGEESGKKLLDLRYAGTDGSMAFTLKQWDDNTIVRAFPGGLTATGSTSSTKNVLIPGTLTLGSSGRDNAILMGIFPLDTTNGKVILARQAIPHLTAASRLAWKLKDPTLLPITVHCVEDTSISSANARFSSRCIYVGDADDTTV